MHATGALKTAILNGDGNAVRGVLDANPDYVDYKLNPNYPHYPHQLAVEQHQLEIAVCLEDEYNCMRKHHSDPRSDLLLLLRKRGMVNPDMTSLGGVVYVPAGCTYELKSEG